MAPKAPPVVKRHLIEAKLAVAPTKHAFTGLLVVAVEQRMAHAIHAMEQQALLTRAVPLAVVLIVIAHMLLVMVQVVVVVVALAATAAAWASSSLLSRR